MAVDLDGTGVQVHVIQPALIAGTELFTLPGNEPPLSDVPDALPPQQVADAVLDALDSGKFEQYVPPGSTRWRPARPPTSTRSSAGVKEWARDQLTPP